MAKIEPSQPIVSMAVHVGLCQKEVCAREVSNQIAYRATKPLKMIASLLASKPTSPSIRTGSIASRNHGHDTPLEISAHRKHDCVKNFCTFL